MDETALLRVLVSLPAGTRIALDFSDVGPLVGNGSTAVEPKLFQQATRALASLREALGVFILYR